MIKNFLCYLICFSGKPEATHAAQLGTGCLGAFKVRDRRGTGYWSTRLSLERTGYLSTSGGQALRPACTTQLPKGAAGTGYEDLRLLPAAACPSIAIGGPFDRIVMNPPFSKGADIAHVRHAFDHYLKPGGRLVAIMSEGPFFRQDRAATDFRNWLHQQGGDAEPLPAGSFRDSGTGVNARIVVVDKTDRRV